MELSVGSGLSGLEGVGKHILWRVGCAIRGEVEAHHITRKDLWGRGKGDDLRRGKGDNLC